LYRLFQGRTLQAIAGSSAPIRCAAATELRTRADTGDHQIGEEPPSGDMTDSVVIEPHGLLVLLLVGLIAGWLAGKLVHGRGFGIIGDIVVGIVGAFIGTWLLARLGVAIGGGLIGEIIDATIGAAVLLVLIRLVRAL
jgi:uncharacterized membrane protein YeaQ/YmgE (transglycosylase-associated protein family)